MEIIISSEEVGFAIVCVMLHSYLLNDELFIIPLRFIDTTQKLLNPFFGLMRLAKKESIWFHEMLFANLIGLEVCIYMISYIDA